jgi:hypothetical protein
MPALPATFAGFDFCHLMKGAQNSSKIHILLWTTVFRVRKGKTGFKAYKIRTPNSRNMPGRELES